MANWGNDEKLNGDKRDRKYGHPFNVELIVRKSRDGKRGLKEIQPTVLHGLPGNEERGFNRRELARGEWHM